MVFHLYLSMFSFCYIFFLSFGGTHAYKRKLPRNERNLLTKAVYFTPLENVDSYPFQTTFSLQLFFLLLREILKLPSRCLI